MKRTRLNTLLSLAILGICAADSPAAAEDTVVVIVNAGTDVESIAASSLSRIFLKKASSFDGGITAAPVDQKYSNDVTDTFCHKVHGKSSSWLRSYWRKQVFSGRSYPPPQKPDDAETIAFVAETNGGVGYVSAGAQLPDTVKVLTVTE